MAADYSPWTPSITIYGTVKFSKLDFASKAFMAYIAPRCAKWIEEQVAGKGLDPWNKPLPPYSKKYKKYKKWIGMNPNKVNLSLSGESWASIAVNYMSKHGKMKIYFKGTHPERGMRIQTIMDNAADRRGRGLWMKRRGEGISPFMGLTDKKEQLVEDLYLEKVIRPRLKGLPPAITQDDIPPAFRKFVFVKK
jgi:hypothetical protein